jgi:protein involved in polysaccharide export with SLBB domain
MNKFKLLAVALVVAAGCSANPGRGTPAAPESPMAPVGDVNGKGAPAGRAGALNAAALTSQMCESDGALKELRDQRMSADNSYDYPVGAGDVLHLTAAELPELNDVTVRVDGDGHIDLPLLGDLQVSGLSEDAVRTLIDQDARKYQKEPRIHVFIRHYAGRNVSVMGMVAQPGSYALDSPDESLLSVLGRAGGIKGNGSEEAADMLVLFPGRPGAGAGSAPVLPPQCAEASPAEATTAAAASDTPRGCTTAAMFNQAGATASVEPIIIDLSKPAMASCLDTPARPGDVVVVPAAGQVGVYGWVDKPGSFNITPGMTALGAITAAGGAMFSSNVEVKRTVRGTRESIPVDLSKVEKGEEPDVPIQAGDVVVVKASAGGAVPYAAYTLFNKLGAGLYMAPAAF